MDWNPSKEDVKFHQTFWENTRNFIHKAVWDHVHQQFQNALSLRCAQFIQLFGWKLFAICAHAEAFQRASVDENDTAWDALKAILFIESRSLEVFARTRGLKWQIPLLSVAWQLPELERVLAPGIDLSRYPPGQIVITENGGLRLARFKGMTQIHIDRSFYIASAYDYAPDPSLRVAGKGSCWLCQDRNPCDCVAVPDIGDLVELIEYPNRGIGVRALTNIKAGDFLGEFVGEIIPTSDESYKSNIYDIDLVSSDPGSEPELVGIVSPAWRGNWVRFINHSCGSSTAFIHANIGMRSTILVKALRDIPIFEEITVNYGAAYWINRECLCGSADCVSRKA